MTYNVLSGTLSLYTTTLFMGFMGNVLPAEHHCPWAASINARPLEMARCTCRILLFQVVRSTVMHM